MMAWYSRERSSFNSSARRSREILYSSAAGLGSAICLLLRFEKTDGSILHHAALAQLSVRDVGRNKRSALRRLAALLTARRVAGRIFRRTARVDSTRSVIQRA